MTNPTTAKELFKVIREFFDSYGTTNPDECHEAWAVLTALRGPDTDDDKTLKLATTAVIRRALLGGTGYRPGTGALHARDSSGKADFRRSMDPGHFMGHALNAFRALGLHWEVDNDIPDEGVPL